MTDYLTYYNINWNKHIQLFDKYSYIQTIFLINPDEINNCLKIGKSFFIFLSTKPYPVLNCFIFILLKIKF